MVPKPAVQEQKAGDGRQRHGAGRRQQKAAPETISGDQAPLRGVSRRQQRRPRRIRQWQTLRSAAVRQSIVNVCFLLRPSTRRPTRNNPGGGGGGRLTPSYYPAAKNVP